jgi:protein phosphatase
MTQLAWGQATDTGQVRAINQDSAYTGEPLFAVADGMGGHRGGEVASKVALETLVATLAGPSTEALVQGVQQANAAVFAQANDDPELRGMGTTLCAVALVSGEAGERLALVNVGDSRIYLLRDGALMQVTEDHSLVESLLRQGRITADEAEVHPQRNILTRALGISATVEVDTWEMAAVTGDRFLLCSDGLFNEVEPAVIQSTLLSLPDATEASTELVRLANEGGGRDNITAVVVDVIDGAPGAVAGPPTRLARASEPDLAGLGTLDDRPTSEAPAVPVEAAPAPPPADLPPAPGFVAETQPDGMAPDPPAPAAAEMAVAPGRSRRLTWRLLAFLVVLLALFGLVGWLLSSYARNTYFVAFDGDDVVIQQGRPEGFLIWQPTVEERTDLTRDDLQAVAVAQVEDEAARSSLSSAQDFVASLQEVGQRPDGGSSTTSTTSQTFEAPSGSGGSDGTAKPG